MSVNKLIKKHLNSNAASNTKCLSKLSFTSVNHIKHCIKLVSLLTICRRNRKLKKTHYKVRVVFICILLS